MRSFSIFSKVLVIFFGVFGGWYGSFLFGISNLPVLKIHQIIDGNNIFENDIEEIKNTVSGDNKTISDRLVKEIRILCLVRTLQSRHREWALNIKETWGSRCNKLLFVTSKIDKNETDFIGILYPNPPTTSNIWKNTEQILHVVYRNYSEFFDWILVTTDDTYVVLENLRYMLTTESAKNALIFGTGEPETNLLTRNAFVLSKVGLGRLTDAFLKSNCTNDEASEMEIMTKCLNYAGTAFGRSTDLLGRNYFNINSISKMLSTFQSMSDYQTMFSYHSVSWSGVTGKDMRLLELFIYKIRSYELKPYKQHVKKTSK